jgi:microcystin-dependent protein
MAISSALGGTVGAVPIGSVTAFAGSAAPSGWLMCGGQTVSRTQFSGLFLTIGTTYGAGDGSTTFALPDLRGRTIAGEDDMGGTAANRLTTGGAGINGATLGATGGSETVTLTSAQSGVPAHGHGVTSTENYSSFGLGYLLNASGRSFSQVTANPALVASIDGYSHTHTVNNNTAANASQAHTNTQPTMVLNYIIRAA